MLKTEMSIKNFCHIMLPGNYKNKLKHLVEPIFNLNLAAVSCGSALYRFFKNTQKGLLCPLNDTRNHLCHFPEWNTSKYLN